MNVLKTGLCSTLGLLSLFLFVYSFSKEHKNIFLGVLYSHKTLYIVPEKRNFLKKGFSNTYEMSSTYEGESIFITAQ